MLLETLPSKKIVWYSMTFCDGCVRARAVTSATSLSVILFGNGVNNKESTCLVSKHNMQAVKRGTLNAEHLTVVSVLPKKFQG